MKEMSLPFRAARRASMALIVPAVLALAACGGDGGAGPTVVPTPTPTPAPAPRVVTQGSFAGLPADAVLRIPFTTTAAGTIDVTVDWTFASNNIELLLARGGCTFEQLEAMACQIAAFAVSPTLKPERLSLPAAAAGEYVLLVANLGPGDESVAFQVVLTSSAAAGQVSVGALAFENGAAAFVRR